MEGNRKAQVDRDRHARARHDHRRCPRGVDRSRPGAASRAPLSGRSAAARGLGGGAR